MEFCPGQIYFERPKWLWPGNARSSEDFILKGPYGALPVPRNIFILNDPKWSFARSSEYFYFERPKMELCTFLGIFYFERSIWSFARSSEDFILNDPNGALHFSIFF